MGENPESNEQGQERRGPGQNEPVTQPDRSKEGGGLDKDLGQGRKAGDEGGQPRPDQDKGGQRQP